MAELATQADLAAWVGHPDDGNYLSCLDWAEAKLEEDTGQVFAAASATDGVVDEQHDGIGKRYLHLRRPASAVSSVKIVEDSDVSDPDESLVAADIIIDTRDKHRIIRKDGSTFPLGDMNVFVTYTAAANLPEIAKRAVLVAAAFVWRRRDKAHITGETIGEFGGLSLFTPEIRRLPEWRAAMGSLKLWGMAA